MHLKVEQWEKDKVLAWMQKYCLGYKQARTRDNIRPHLDFTDRKLRAIISELKHSGEIGSTASLGYWCIPLVSNDRGEVEAALSSVAEMKAKALSMLKDSNNLEDRFQLQLNKITQGQKEFSEVRR